MVNIYTINDTLAYDNKAPHQRGYRTDLTGTIQKKKIDLPALRTRKISAFTSHYSNRNNEVSLLKDRLLFSRHASITSHESFNGSA